MPSMPLSRAACIRLVPFSMFTSWAVPAGSMKVTVAIRYPRSLWLRLKCVLDVDGLVRHQLRIGCFLFRQRLFAGHELPGPVDGVDGDKTAFLVIESRETAACLGRAAQHDLIEAL